MKVTPRSNIIRYKLEDLKNTDYDKDARREAVTRSEKFVRKQDLLANTAAMIGIVGTLVAIPSAMYKEIVPTILGFALFAAGQYSLCLKRYSKSFEVATNWYREGSILEDIAKGAY